MPDETSSGQGLPEEEAQPPDAPRGGGYGYLPTIGAFGLGAFALIAWLLGWFGLGGSGPPAEDAAPPPGQEAQKSADEASKQEDQIPGDLKPMAQVIKKIGIDPDILLNKSTQIIDDPAGDFIWGDPEVKPGGTDASADLRRWTAFIAEVPAGQAPPWGQSALGCGQAGDIFTVCPQNMSGWNVPGQFVAVAFCFGADIPLQPDGRAHNYSFPFDRDGSAANNLQASEQFPWDYYHGGDTVGALDLGPSEPWSAEMIDMTLAGAPTPTGPWAALDGPCGVAVWPADMVGSPDAILVRVTGESHDGRRTIASFTGDVDADNPTNGLRSFRAPESLPTAEWPLLSTGGGDDVIETGSGGSDTIEGGGGDDRIEGLP